ncbi:MAG: ribosome maturation factor RimM [Bryobacter sp.]
MVPSGWITLGTVLRTRGNRGEVVVDLLTSSVERFRGVSGLVWFHDQAPERLLEVEDAWLHDGKCVLRFAGVDSISAAEELRGGDLCIPLSQRRPLAEGETFLSDWVGVELFDEAGQRLAQVADWYEEGNQVWFRLEPGAVLLPYAKEFFVAVDFAAKRATARLPEGLLELGSS